MDTLEPVPFEYCGFWRRFVAVLLDTIIFIALGIVVGIIIGTFFPESIKAAATSPAQATNNTPMKEWLSWGFQLFGVAYSILLPCSPLQGTLGKWIMGMKIINSEGNRISLLQSIGRSFIQSITVCLSCLFIPFTEYKQGLHDKVASTFVVRR